MVITLVIVGSLAVLLLLAIVGLGVALPAVGRITKGEPDRYIRAGGNTLRYRDSGGSGMPVVMLHGFGGTLAEWEPLASMLTDARVIRLDLIGFGLSDKPRMAYSLETERECVCAFLDALGIPTAFLVGSSMGSSIALWTAARSPERVAGLAVFAPSAYPGSMRHAWPGDLIYRTGAVNRLIRAVTGSALYGWLFPGSLGRQAMDITASYDNAFTACLPAVRQPVLLIWSRGDKRVPFAYSGKYRELLPNAAFMEAAPESGHSAAGHPTREIVDGIRAIMRESGS